ncbi:MAG: HesA/MoeB/ThiF family protein [Flavobacteriaceae bacterium]|nr:HesA/MoeB/ThiF family protein [Flavobacteriaceae bacterium]
MSQNRYLRQTSLVGFGPDSQEKLGEAKVLVVGAGGLGIPVLQYLTAMGIGTVGIVENDTIDLTNLQRQVLYSEKDVNHPKIQVASERLNALNSDINIKLHPCFLTAENSLDIISEYDVVVDASDNFPTRYLINDSCVILKKPFVYGALHGFEGQVSVFNYKAGPTYRCLFPNKPSSDEIPNCDVNGVLGIIPSIIGSLQCLETIKIITGIGKVALGELVIW